ncbi:hypothetical protein ACHWQZ_G006216 [Mnemiopsis leidyi]
MSSSTTIMIRIKDKSPLCVDSPRLTDNSCVFKRLICELNQTEIELTDFESGTVEMFFTLLSDKTLSEIKKEQFRELHKLAVSFNVSWLKKSCRDWLRSEIDKAKANLEQFHFVFEESLFISDKWRVQKFVGLIISKYSAQDNSLFFEDYMKNFDKMEERHIEVLLLLAGSNPAQLLRLPIEKVNNRRCVISKKTKFLLENVNLALLYERTPDEHLRLFEGLKEIHELSRDDLKFTLDLMTESVKKVIQRAEVPAGGTQIRSKGEKWATFYQEYSQSIPDTLDEITSFILGRKINDMELVVLLMVRACRRNPPSEDRSEYFLRNLVNITKYKGYNLKRVPACDVDLLIDSIKGSPLPETHQCIALLEGIRNSFSLTSYNETIHMRGKQLWELKNQSSIQKHQSNFTILRRQLLLSVEEVYRYAFVFKSKSLVPGVRDCAEAGLCGFILDSKNFGTGNLELCTAAETYRDSGIHHHRIHSAERMESFCILEGMSSNDRKKKGVPSWWAHVGEWFPDIEYWEPKKGKIVICYDSSEFMAKKF